MSVAWSWRHAILKSAELAPEHQLRSTTRHVLLTLSVYMTDAGQPVYPSTKTLAEGTGLSERAVCEHLAIAVEQGWLKVDRHGFGSRRWKAHQYTPMWPGGTDRPSVPQTDEALTLAPRGTDRPSVESSKGINKTRGGAHEGVPVSTREGRRKGAGDEEVQCALVKADDPDLYAKAVELSGRSNRMAWREAEFDQSIVDRARRELNTEAGAALRGQAPKTSANSEQVSP